MKESELLRDLYVAYFSAKKHKNNRSYVKHWNKNLKENMKSLCEDLYNRTYTPTPSKCFIVNYPKKREIFAANFRDRIIHHLYFNYTHTLFEKSFIYDSYSCIKGRGTHFGIKRLEGFCRKESHNWKRPCYTMHLDIRGYFMHISRIKLLDIALKSISNMSSHRINEKSFKTWEEILDMDFINWLTEKIIALDPCKDPIIIGDKNDWIDLDPWKSLFTTKKGLGLPIGNLTSQLLSNVYLNPLDQFIKRNLKFKYYGRYVDDGIIVCSDKSRLLSSIQPIREFLKNELMLDLHNGKLNICEIHNGTEFLGTFIKPYRTYTSRKTIKRIKNNLNNLDFSKPYKIIMSINSYLGILRHTSSYNLRKSMFLKKKFLRFGTFNNNLTKFIGRKKYLKI